MKQGLRLPYATNREGRADFKADPRKYGIKLQIAMQEQKAKEFNLMLDKWKKSGHTVKSSDDLINCIRGAKS